LEITAIIFNNLVEARQLAAQAGIEEMSECIDQAWLHLAKLAEITHKLFPRSPLVSIHR